MRNEISMYFILGVRSPRPDATHGTATHLSFDGRAAFIGRRGMGQICCRRRQEHDGDQLGNMPETWAVERDRIGLVLGPVPSIPTPRQMRIVTPDWMLPPLFGRRDVSSGAGASGDLPTPRAKQQKRSGSLDWLFGPQIDYWTGEQHKVD